MPSFFNEPDYMKKCPYCGSVYPDSVEVCPADLNRLDAINANSLPQRQNLPSQQPDPAAEQRFWEHMTFRHFGVLIIRLQAAWFLFYAVLDATYVPSYVVRITSIFSMPHFYQPGLSAFLALFRVILHIVMAVLCITCAESILSWLVRHMIPKASSSDSPNSNQQT